MGRAEKYVLALVLGAAVPACAGAGTGSPSMDVPDEPMRIETGGRPLEITREKQVTSAQVDVPLTEAWSRLLTAYRALGIPASALSVNPGSHTVGVVDRRTSRLAGQRMSRYLNCGYSLGTSKADQGQVRVTLQTTLAPAGEATVVRTRFQAMAGTSGVSTAPIPCASTGALERVILERVVGADPG